MAVGRKFRWLGPPAGLQQQWGNPADECYSSVAQQQPSTWVCASARRSVRLSTHTSGEVGFRCVPACMRPCLHTRPQQLQPQPQQQHPAVLRRNDYCHNDAICSVSVCMRPCLVCRPPPHQQQLRQQLLKSSRQRASWHLTHPSCSCWVGLAAARAPSVLRLWRSTATPTCLQVRTMMVLYGDLASIGGGSPLHRLPSFCLTYHVFV